MSGSQSKQSLIPSSSESDSHGSVALAVIQSSVCGLDGRAFIILGIPSESPW